MIGSTLTGLSTLALKFQADKTELHFAVRTFCFCSILGYGPPSDTLMETQLVMLSTSGRLMDLHICRIYRSLFTQPSLSQRRSNWGHGPSIGPNFFQKRIFFILLFIFCSYNSLLFGQISCFFNTPNSYPIAEQHSKKLEYYIHRHSSGTGQKWRWMNESLQPNTDRWLLQR